MVVGKEFKKKTGCQAQNAQHPDLMLPAYRQNPVY
jgi:hypothetical protein